MNTRKYRCKTKKANCHKRRTRRIRKGCRRTRYIVKTRTRTIKLKGG